MSAGSSRGPEQTAGRTPACLWFSRQEWSEPLARDEIEVWESWIADPENRADYDELITTVSTLKNHSPPRLPGQAELRAGLAQERNECRERTVNRVCTSRTGPVLTSFGFSVAVAAVVAFCAGVALVVRYWPEGTGIAPASAYVYATAPTEHRELTLADQSVVTLAGDSHLTVMFTPTKRTAVLHHGEGRFRIHHDPKRPFSVLAGAGVITAVGTVFDVRRYSDRVLVTVSEGVVEVLPEVRKSVDELTGQARSPEAIRAVPLRVARGEEIAYDAQGEASAAQQVDIRLAASWIHGSLAYRGRPLREVIEDVQRYSVRRIELDPGIGELRYTGTFVEENLDQWLRGLSQIFPVEVVPDGPEHILIRRRQNSAQEETAPGH